MATSDLACRALFEIGVVRPKGEANTSGPATKPVPQTCNPIVER